MNLLNDILILASKQKASDIHISSEEKVAIRKVGNIEFLSDFNIPSKKDVLEIISTLAGSEIFEILKTQKEYDFSYSDSRENRYRCHIFFKKGHPCLSMRRIENKIRSLKEIEVPEKIIDLLRKKQGLILLSGPAGSGKSTTMAAMLDWINSNKNEHILTIEDPIEYHIASKNCLVSQRELHGDTKSFSDSLRSAMRQDPNIIAIGEIRDLETAQAVFQLCNTGHLVISTIHTESSSQTLNRIVNMFPKDKHNFILSQLGDSILGILNQRLISTIKLERKAIFEFMIANHAIKNAIRNGDISQIENTIATSLNEGMMTFQKNIEKLLLQEKIDFQKACSFLS